MWVALRCLGSNLYYQDQLKQARELLEQSLQLSAKLSSKSGGIEMAQTKLVLGGFLQYVGDYNLATSYLNDALQVFRKLKGQESWQTGSVLNILGMINCYQGEYESSLINLN